MGEARRLAFAIIGVLALAATSCGNGKKAPEPTGVGEVTPPAIDAASATTTPPPVGEYTCAADDDCVISCEIADSCCGEACQCELPYHRDQEDAIREANAKKCAIIDADCPQYDCDRPSEDIVPVCVDGTCGAKRVPR
jgi:hypothetical protein